MTLPELPQPGEIYLQLGIRLVISHVTPAEITYCARQGEYTGPPLHYPTERFLKDVAAGRVIREEPS